MEAEGGGLAHRDREGDGIGESNAERPGVSRIVLLHGGMEGSQSSEGKDTRKGRLYETKQKDQGIVEEEGTKRPHNHGTDRWNPTQSGPAKACRAPPF